MGWYRLMAQLLNRTPACPVCGEPTTVVDEHLVHDLPPVLEAHYRCPGCGEAVVRRDVTDVWS
jgi:ribosomal protein L37AE/L43A